MRQAQLESNHAGREGSSSAPALATNRHSPPSPLLLLTPARLSSCRRVAVAKALGMVPSNWLYARDSCTQGHTQQWGEVSDPDSVLRRWHRSGVDMQYLGCLQSTVAFNSLHPPPGTGVSCR